MDTSTRKKKKQQQQKKKNRRKQQQRHDEQQSGEKRQEPKQHHHHQSKRRRRNKGDDNNGDDKKDVMVDILAQLKIQRANAAASSNKEDASNDATNTPHKDRNTSSPPSTKTKQDEQVASLSNSDKKKRLMKQKRQDTKNTKINIHYINNNASSSTKSPIATTTGSNNKKSTHKKRRMNQKDSSLINHPKNGKKLSSTTTKSSPPPSVLGNYYYDAIQNTYFPLKHCNSKKTQHHEPQQPQHEKEDSVLSLYKLLHQSRHPTNNKSTKFNKSAQHLLYHHMATEYSTNPHVRCKLKRTIQDAFMIRGLCIVPTTTPGVTEKTSRKKKKKQDEKKRHDYYSMLYPIVLPSSNINSSFLLRGEARRLPESMDHDIRLQPGISSTTTTDPTSTDPKIPLDCRCKTMLHPTAPTFDVKQPLTSSHAMLPHIVTIIDGGLYYRPPYQPFSRKHKPFVLHGQMNLNNNSLWAIGDEGARVAGEVLPISTGLQNLQNVVYRGVKFAPFQRHGNDNNILVGAMACDSSMKNHVFTMAEVGSSSSNSGQIGSIQGGGVVPDFLRYSVRLGGAMNDFSFSSGSSWGAPGKVAFAPNLSPRYVSCLKPSLLDLEHMRRQHVSSASWQHCPSDVLCVEYQDSNRCDTILYGHRNGSISLLDCRSGSFSSIHKFEKTSRNSSQMNEFGSVTSIQPLRYGECIIAKGSFGSMRVFDLRRLEARKHSTSSSSPSSLLWKLSAPRNMIHQTRSTRCTGLALGQNESVAISPFALRGEQNQPMLGIWSLSSGKFLGHSNLSQSKSIPSEKEAACLSYCELSRVRTNAWGLSSYSSTKDDKCGYIDSNQDVLVEERHGEWGLFFKSGNILHPTEVPREAGGIHHVCFPGSFDRMGGLPGRW